MSKTKTCAKCNKEKALKGFSCDLVGVYRSTCRACRAAEMRALRATEKAPKYPSIEEIKAISEEFRMRFNQ